MGDNITNYNSTTLPGQTPSLNNLIFPNTETIATEADESKGTVIRRDYPVSKFIGLQLCINLRTTC